MKTYDGVMTEEEYLVREPEAEYKSEFRDGRMFAMVGASLAHSRLTMNLARIIGNALVGRPCNLYSSESRIKVAAAQFYTYPDLSVVCGKAIVDAKDKCALLNPTLIVEVLSPSIEAYDRGQKFTYYKQLASLREYLLVAQDRVGVERFTLSVAGPMAGSVEGAESGEWISTKFLSLDDWVDLPSIGLPSVAHRRLSLRSSSGRQVGEGRAKEGCRISVRDIYNKVEL